MKNNPARERTQPARREKRIAICFKHAAVVLFAICFMSIYTAHTFSFPMLGPETEQRIDRLVNHGADRFPLPRNWRFTDLDIFIRLEKTTRGNALFRLACTSFPSDSRFLGESNSLRMELVSFSGVNEREAVQPGRSLLERIRLNDTPLFFNLPSSPTTTENIIWKDGNLRRQRS